MGLQFDALQFVLFRHENLPPQTSPLEKVIKSNLASEVYVQLTHVNTTRATRHGTITDQSKLFPANNDDAGVSFPSMIFHGCSSTCSRKVEANQAIGVVVVVVHQLSRNLRLLD